MNILHDFVSYCNVEIVKSTVLSVYNVATGTLVKIPLIGSVVTRVVSPTQEKTNYSQQNGTIMEESDDENDDKGYVSNGNVANGTVTNGTVLHTPCPVVECLDKRLKPVAFEWIGPERDRVAISGEFYNWQIQMPLNRKSKKFAAQIDLPKGRHQFKFIVNGVWKHSSYYPTVQNSFGDVNNYVDVV